MFKISTRAFSLIEVIIAAIIFVISTAGVMSTIAKTGTSSLSNTNRLNAALYGKKILDELNKDVVANITSGNLSPGIHPSSGSYTDARFPGLSAVYTVTLVNSGDVYGLRKVDVTVTW